MAEAALDRSKGGILPLASKEELVELAAAPEDPAEQATGMPSPEPTTATKESIETGSSRSATEAYARAVVLKDEGQLKEAVDLFQSAARHATLRLKSYTQVGLCYVKMKDHHAAVQAFRTAIDDPTALEQDVLEVLYVLGRSLESVGDGDQARDVYHRINRSAPTFRDVTNRLRELQTTSKQSNPSQKTPAGKPSWFGGVMHNVQRFLIGNPK